ncbi:hypothetical protein GCM10011371_29770 [Novosphingobium marinum]|uniref:SnoaL-like domain-containing protein n=1 Tax=Novosphingobium marinum TaxID=1514948 RepID=A0A7Y9XY45_9SPHN|nr:nuclear transport factor 2 family protein [Novosphingobium marinum]NYH96761.1 hypothetical protein [Novosphingobium marinum]GGC40439.1 hypothetical protein GCM10011371_29770 [Novosphingobium marinum]
MTKEMQSVEERLAIVEDERAIEKVLADYALALDWIDMELLDKVFWDDAEIDYGFFQGSGRDFKPVVMDVEKSLGRRMHMVSNVRLSVTGNSAKASGYHLSIASPEVDKPVPDGLSVFAGYYLDTLEKRDGRWGISSRKHILVGGSQIPEIPLEGDMDALNRIGETRGPHPERDKLPYR